jgi:hypothetical protein
VLADERRRGHVAVDDAGRFMLTLRAERRFGRALREVNRPAEE